MKQKKGNDNSMTYVAAVAAACLVLGYVIAWTYFKPAPATAGSNVAFATVGPLRGSSQGYSFSATLAVQTAAGDESWVQDKAHEVNLTLQQALIASDPETLRSPAGLEAAQEMLAATLNRSLGAPRVQRVLFTDFILQAD